MNSYVFVDGIEICKFKVKDSERNASLLCLDNIYKDFWVDNMKKTMDMSQIFHSIMIILMLMIFKYS